jgi:hypothetical protein
MWGMSVVKASKPISLYTSGEYQARSYLDSKRGTAFAVDFILTKGGEGWNNLSLEILRVNFQTTFIVLGIPIIVFPTLPVLWSFSNLNSNKPLFNGGKSDQPTRFDRIIALLDED